MREAHQRMNEMHSRAFSNMFNDPFFSSFPSSFFDHDAFLSLPPSDGRGHTRIEEVPQNEYHLHQAGNPTRQYPIIQEPDEHEVPGRESEGRQVRPRQHGQSVGHRPNISSPSTYTFIYSSSFASKGRETVQKTTQARMGPGGVREYQSTLKDGEKESITIARGLGDGRAREMTRTRLRDGRETSNDKLSGMREEEAEGFDRDWMASASRALPNYQPGQVNQRSLSERRPRY